MTYQQAVEYARKDERKYGSRGIKLFSRWRIRRIGRKYLVEALYEKA